MINRTLLLNDTFDIISQVCLYYVHSVAIHCSKINANALLQWHTLNALVMMVIDNDSQNSKL